jgi:hypothetical protein
LGTIIASWVVDTLFLLFIIVAFIPSVLDGKILFSYNSV